MSSIAASVDSAAAHRLHPNRHGVAAMPTATAPREPSQASNAGRRSPARPSRQGEGPKLPDAPPLENPGRVVYPNFTFRNGTRVAVALACVGAAALGYGLWLPHPVAALAGASCLLVAAAVLLYAYVRLGREDPDRLVASYANPQGYNASRVHAAQLGPGERELIRDTLRLLPADRRRAALLAALGHVSRPSFTCAHWVRVLGQASDPVAYDRLLRTMNPPQDPEQMMTYEELRRLPPSAGVDQLLNSEAWQAYQDRVAAHGLAADARRHAAYASPPRRPSAEADVVAGTSSGRTQAPFTTPQADLSARRAAASARGNVGEAEFFAANASFRATQAARRPLHERTLFELPFEARAVRREHADLHSADYVGNAGPENVMETRRQDTCGVAIDALVDHYGYLCRPTDGWHVDRQIESLGHYVRWGENRSSPTCKDNAQRMLARLSFVHTYSTPRRLIPVRYLTALLWCVIEHKRTSGSASATDVANMRHGLVNNLADCLDLYGRSVCNVGVTQRLMTTVAGYLTEVYAAVPTQATVGDLINALGSEFLTELGGREANADDCARFYRHSMARALDNFPGEGGVERRETFRRLLLDYLREDCDYVPADL